MASRGRGVLESRMPRSGTVYLVDGSAQLHRAYFAIRGLATSRGLPTNATYGFTTMLQKLIQDEQPEWLGICFDVKGPTFRHEEYPEYKAHRPRMDEDLAVQIPYVRRVCEVFRLPVIEAEGVEADDVIATLSRQAVEAGLRVVVVTGDKDLLQIVSEDVRVLNPGREGAGATLYDAKAVEAKLGVPPERVVDLLALMGDQADNVPGVRGIGEKGARTLIDEFGSLGVGFGEFVRPKDVAVDETGLVYVTDAAFNNVQIFGPDFNDADIVSEPNALHMGLMNTEVIDRHLEELVALLRETNNGKAQ